MKFCSFHSGLHGAQIRDQLSALVKPTLLGDILDQFNQHTETLFRRYLSDFVKIIYVTSHKMIQKKCYGVSK